MLKALSLTQPWASLLVSGAKRVETRSWRTTFTGRLAIHASKAFPTEARAQCWEPAFRTALSVWGLVDYFSYSDLDEESLERYALPLGAIVGTASLVCVRPTGHVTVDEREAAFGNYEPGRFAWTFVDMVRFDKPIPCRGSLGLWVVPPEIEGVVERQRASS